MKRRLYGIVVIVVIAATAWIGFEQHSLFEDQANKLCTASVQSRQDIRDTWHDAFKYITANADPDKRDATRVYLKVLRKQIDKRLHGSPLCNAE